MAYESGITWTDGTWNPWMGCSKVSEACTRCYIDGIIRRQGKVPFDGPFRTGDATWRKPLTWNKKQKKGSRHRIFTCSMSDFFHTGADQWRPEAWDIIKRCDRLLFLILTKRIENVADRLPDDWGAGYDNVWLGVTCEQQKHTDRIEKLLTIPASLRWVSAEPLLEELNLRSYLGRGQVEWVIDGCEQAGKQKRRPMSPIWNASLRIQCEQSKVAYFHKQHYDGSQLKHDGMQSNGKMYLQVPKF